jgi:DNA-binding LacI/PurR family transcriptional regulator
MRVRLRDVAERAGVSITTVSHVLSGYTKSGIKQETRDRVQRIAAEMGYRTPAARGTRGRARTLAFYTGHGFRDFRDAFMAEIYSGLMLGCDQYDLDLLIHGNLSEQDPEQVVAKLVDGRIDGLVLHAPPADPIVPLISEGRLAAVAIADGQIGIPSVVADDATGMDMLVDYLWRRGHRKVAFLNTIYPMPSVEARVKRFQNALSTRSGEAVVVDMPYGNIPNFLESWKADPAHPTAFCVWNDRHAYSILEAAIGAGIAVPDELAVCGFDGVLNELLPARRLVSIRVPWQKLAAEAVKMLVGPARDETVSVTTRFPVEFVPGDTA